jgi:hypothetical protein
MIGINSNSSSSSSNNRSSKSTNAVKKYSKTVGLGQIGDVDADLALQCIANAYSCNEKEPMKAAASEFNLCKLQNGETFVVNETLLQKFVQQHALKKRESKHNPVKAEKKNIVGEKQNTRINTLKRKRQQVKDIRINSEKKQAYCTKARKPDEYEWYNVNDLNADRLKNMLRNIGVTFNNSIKVDAEALLKDVEDNWPQIVSYYEKVRNAAVV